APARLHPHAAVLRARPERGDETAGQGAPPRGGDRRPGDPGARPLGTRHHGAGRPDQRRGGGHAMSQSPTPEMNTHSRADGEILLSCRNVTKEFSVAGSTIVAVDDVSLEFPEASVLAVVGESGSGKSTLARIDRKSTRLNS